MQKDFRVYTRKFAYKIDNKKLQPMYSKKKKKKLKYLAENDPSVKASLVSSYAALKGLKLIEICNSPIFLDDADIIGK